MNGIRLAEHIKKFVGLDPGDEKILLTITTPKILNQSEFLLSKNQVNNSLFFVESGCLRMYFKDKYNTEQIIQFAIEGWWIADYVSFMNKLPSDYYIQTTEKSEIISLDKNMYDTLDKVLPQVETYFKLIMQKNLAATQTKAQYLHSMTKEELLYYFCNSFPEFVNRVPKYMVESYLGTSTKK